MALYIRRKTLKISTGLGKDDLKTFLTTHPISVVVSFDVIVAPKY